MSYTKQEFVSGQILKAEHLNHMENGIESNTNAVASLSEEIDRNAEFTVNVLCPPDGYEAAVADGSADTSAKINALLNQFGHVYLPNGTYLIESSLIVDGNKHIEIDGVLKVKCAAGIVVTGKDNIISGHGTIMMDGSVVGGSAVKCIATNAELINNWISVTRIECPLRDQDCIGIEFTGEESFGYGYFNHIETFIKRFKYGIYAHASEGQNEESWITAYRIHSDVEICERAIWIEWSGEGSELRGNIQPVCDEENPHVIDAPLTKMAGGTCSYLHSWDFHAAVNKYAYEILGPNSEVVEFLGEDKFLLTPLVKRTFIRRDEKPPRRLSMTSAEANEPDRFTDLNDILYFCHDEPGMELNITPQEAVAPESLHALFTGKGEIVYMHGNGEYGTERVFTVSFATLSQRRETWLFSRHASLKISRSN